MFSIVRSNYFRWRRWRFGNILKCIHTFCRAEKSENLAKKFQNKLSFVSENGIFSFSCLNWELYNISHPIWHLNHQYLDWYHLQYESMGKRVRYALKQKKTMLFGNFSQTSDPHPPLLGTPYPKATTLSILEWWLNVEIDKISLPPHL